MERADRAMDAARRGALKIFTTEVRRNAIHLFVSVLRLCEFHQALKFARGCT